MLKMKNTMWMAGALALVLQAGCQKNKSYEVVVPSESFSGGHDQREADLLAKRAAECESSLEKYASEFDARLASKDFSGAVGVYGNCEEVLQNPSLAAIRSKIQVALIGLATNVDGAPKERMAAIERLEKYEISEPNRTKIKNIKNELNYRLSSKWVYESKPDPMTGKVRKFARITSANTVDLKSPYTNASGHLMIRYIPGEGPDVLFSISDGQLVCGVLGCQILVRFDDGAPVKFSGSPPSDFSSGSVFLSPAGRFIGEAKKAKKIRIQADVYQAGRPVLEYDSGPLLWSN